MKPNDRYLGNPNLPTPQAEFEYSAEMIKEIGKCKQNILHFAENYFYIVNLDVGRIKIKLHPYQKRILRSLRDNRFVCLLSSRQAGKTTVMTIYCLWLACFNQDQRILLVANKEETAKEIFARVRLAYENLPNYLKPGVTEYGKTAMGLANGSRISISTTSSDAGRGSSVNVLVIDELAHIDNNMVDTFWSAVYPIISSSKKSKIFVASTPNGTGNLFYQLYTDGLEGKNNWKTERVDWDEVPGRDEKWKNDTIKSLGSRELFDQEFGNCFLQEGESALNADDYEKYKSSCCNPLFIFDEGKYKIWEQPEKNGIYVAGVDVAEGVGQASSVIQIFDIADLSAIRQVACFRDNTITPYNFTVKLSEILSQWGNPPLLVERNNCGAQVADSLFENYNYDPMISYAQGKSFEKPGVFTNTNTKYHAVINMRYWINELRSVVFRDLTTLEELKTFIRYPNGTWGARKGGNVHDDCVMSMAMAFLILTDDLVEKYYEVTSRDNNNRPSSLVPFKKTDSSNFRFFGSEDFPSMPVIFSTKDRNEADIEMDYLEKQGWKIL
jgi:hypothetical protein